MVLLYDEEVTRSHMITALATMYFTRGTLPVFLVETVAQLSMDRHPTSKYRAPHNTRALQPCNL